MSSEPTDSNFRFAISLSVLNHLGRNLYRNFITVLGEAISNAWDADAKNVWIDIDRENSTFSIKDDGTGMDEDDFQEKFLKIGYSKRVDGTMETEGGRPFIGAKGIGKLALLSCADRVSIFTKKEDTEYTGGVIDNSGLDEAIRDDLVPDDYPLEELNSDLIESLRHEHSKGTILVFEGTKENIRNSIAHIRKLLALSFRFSLIDPEFSLILNGEAITADDLKDVNDATEFLWNLNQCQDDYLKNFSKLASGPVSITTAMEITGFVASVKKPRNLKISGTDERATIDLFVNGRLREKDILRHIPTQRIVESYLYGQIHFDSMDRPGIDPFTSSREGVVDDDKNFLKLLDYLKKDAIPQIFDDWDKLRLARGEEGDEENKRKSRKERKASGLVAAAREEFEPEDDAPNKDQVDAWLNELKSDAEFNTSAYVDCYLSENLVRSFITAHDKPLCKGAPGEIEKWKGNESTAKANANISFEIRKGGNDLFYLGMDELALTAEGKKPGTKTQSLWIDAIAYKPARNVVGHTGRLTDPAKAHLSLILENIKGRVKTLVSSNEDEDGQE